MPRPTLRRCSGWRLAAGFWHSLAIKTDGSLWAWGSNGHGQLGDGTTTHHLSPVPVIGFGGLPSDADFTVTNVTLNPSAPLTGGTFNAAITVKNRGTQAGNPGLLRVWTNQPQTQSCDAPGDAEINLANLAAGAKQTVSIRLPAGIAGYKTLRTFIDSQCRTTEPDETNSGNLKCRCDFSRTDSWRYAPSAARPTAASGPGDGASPASRDAAPR